MIEYKHEDLFRDGTDKQLSIVSVDGKVNITNSEIHYEQFELKESLCSQSELTFGTCEASQIKFKISNVFTSMVGMQLAVTTTLEGQKDALFSFGKYWVVSDKPTADRRYRNVTAYDFMYYILNKDVAAWYKGLTFPMTLRQFRDSFCAYVGVEQEEITLVNDDMVVEKTIDPEELPGKTVIEAICEINGCFGHIGRNGKLRYVVLVQMIEGLYPADDLYPSDDLYARRSPRHWLEQTCRSYAWQSVHRTCRSKQSRPGNSGLRSTQVTSKLKSHGNTGEKSN